MKLTKRDTIIALIASAATATCVAAVNSGPNVIGERTWNWNDLKVQKTAVGEVRHICNGPTATLDNLEMHVTTLDPGKASHPPHHHPNEEMIIVDKGTVEALINGHWERVGPGSVIFNASNVTHDLRNVGNAPAQYHVINWRTDRTPQS